MINKSEIRMWDIKLRNGRLEYLLTVRRQPYSALAFLGTGIKEVLQDSPALQNFAGPGLQVIATSGIERLVGLVDQHYS